MILQYDPAVFRMPGNPLTASIFRSKLDILMSSWRASTQKQYGPF